MDCDVASSGGMMIAVVGPSGVGKDTLMSAAAQHFAQHERVFFVRRTITRAAGSGGEDHDGVSRETFDQMVTDDAFSVWWGAHGLKYGVPRSACDEMAKGRIAVVNGSRSALGVFSRVFTRLKVISITARPEVLAERLAARGRESRDDILNRLARAPTDLPPGLDVVTIDNSDDLETARKAFIAALEEAVASS